MEKLGICMEGNEALWEQLIRASVQHQRQHMAPNLGPKDKPTFLYVELGVGGGDTFVPTVQYLRQLGGMTAFGLGVDIVDGWSYNKALPAHMKSLGMDKYATILKRSDNPIWEMDLMSDELEDIRYELTEEPHFDWRANFVFIDGCHGAACVKKDLLSVIPILAEGAVVVFHDASESCQGHHFQHHCKTGIAVRQGLRELGMFDLGYPFRFVEESKAPHSIAAFQFATQATTKPIF